MISRDFEIYYYSDTHMPQVNTHTHNYYEFYFFLEGDVSIQIADSLYPLRPGDMILIPPSVPHHAIIQNPDIPYRRFVFWISSDYCNQLLTVSSDYGYIMQYVLLHHDYVFHFDVLAFNALQLKVFSLIEEIQSERFGRGAKISLCVNDLILHLNRSIYEQQHPQSPSEQLSLYQNVLQYIEGHLEEDLSLDQLAQTFFVSKYHIAHIFKDNLGLSIHQYIMKKRLAACRDAIVGHTVISEAYLSYGFKDYSSFYRAFKREYGLSPKEYQNLYANRSNPV